MRVLELSDDEAAAAYCGKLFARCGADVAKVESEPKMMGRRATMVLAPDRNAGAKQPKAEDNKPAEQPRPIDQPQAAPAAKP